MTAKIGPLTAKKGRPRRDELSPAWPSLFGGRLKTAVLVLVFLLAESYPRELARLTSASLSSVQLATEALEREGALATRLIGNTRRVCLNPRYFAAQELRMMLTRLVQGFPMFEEVAASVRRRPRRAGKPL